MAPTAPHALAPHLPQAIISPIHDWRTDAAPPDFHGRMAAGHYALPGRSRGAPAAQPPPTQRGTASSSPPPANDPPSLSSTCPTAASAASPATSLVSRLARDAPPAAVDAGAGAGPLECAFAFLRCGYRSRDEAEWRAHCLAHFGGAAPPAAVQGPLCDHFEGVRFADGAAAWRARLDHVALHHWGGRALGHSGPDEGLLWHLWRKGVVGEAEMQAVAAGAAGASAPERYTVTQGGGRDKRRGRHLR